MKLFAFIFLLYFAIFPQITFAFDATPTYADYFKARDALIKRMDSKKEGYNEFEKAEPRLISMLQRIIGPTKSLAGFDGKVELSIFSLYDYGSYEKGKEINILQFFPKVRGYSYNQMFVTTKTLFDEMKDPKLGEFAASKVSSIIQGQSDCAWNDYLELPLKNQDKSIDTYAALALCSQDPPYPYGEGSLIVSVVKNEKMIAVIRDLKSDEIGKIDYCIKEFEDNKAREVEDEKNFNNYVKCFASKAQSQKFYPIVLKNAQQLLDEIINSEKK